MRLKERYNKEIVKKLKEEFGYKNIHEVPKLLKVNVNVGFGRQAKEKQLVDSVEKGLIKIAGQKCVMAKAKKSISAFKIRQGMVIGAYVTLRGNRMFDFIEKLISITLPRVRDFRGISEKAIDRTGNITIGFKDCSAFPEISAEEMENIIGLEVTISNSAKTKKEGLALLRALGIPFKNDSL
jgi:large subunit ribosomal protein L5